MTAVVRYRKRSLRQPATRAAHRLLFCQQGAASSCLCFDALTLTLTPAWQFLKKIVKTNHIFFATTSFFVLLSLMSLATSDTIFFSFFFGRTQLELKLALKALHSRPHFFHEFPVVFSIYPASTVKQSHTCPSEKPGRLRNESERQQERHRRRNGCHESVVPPRAPREYAVPTKSIT